MAKNKKDGENKFQDNNTNANKDSLYQKFAGKDGDRMDKGFDKNTYKIRTKGF